MATVLNIVDCSLSTSDESVTEPIIRSRTWSEDITVNWHTPSGREETVSQRLERYATYFTLTKEQMSHIMTRFIQEMDLALYLKNQEPNVQWPSEKCSLPMLDTCVSHIPKGDEVAETYAIDLGGTNFRSIKAKFLGNGKIAMTTSKTELRCCSTHLPKGLLDKEATASQFFDVLASSLQSLIEEESAFPRGWSPVGFTFSFPIAQKSLKSATLVTWTKEFETGRGTDDKVEGSDVCALLDQALWRNEVTAKVAAVLNDTTGTLLSCAYEKPAHLPPCLVGFIAGTGVNGCYFQDDAEDFGYKGRIINTECGAFDKGLPFTDVDLEVDFAYAANRHQQLFEKMTSGMYIGELCRRLIIKVFQKSAPELVWVKESLPAEVASLIINDVDSQCRIVKEIVGALWKWDASQQECEQIKTLVTLVFDRSAALVSTVIAGMAKKTGRLQPAMGGVTVGVDGSLYTQNKWYRERMHCHLEVLLGDGAKLIHLCQSNDGSGKGAAVLAAVCKAAQTPIRR